MDPTIALEPVRAFADPPLVDDAAELLAAAPLHAIGFAFTSSSYVRGAADDEVLRQRLETRTHGIPVAICSVSAVLGLRALGARRVALVDPPWFSPELTALGVDYFTSQGFAIVHAASAGVPSEQRAINPGQLFEWVREHVPAEATRSTSAATACARWVSSRRWRKTCASPCSRRTRSSSGISCVWLGPAYPLPATAACSIVTCPPKPRRQRVRRIQPTRQNEWSYNEATAATQSIYPAITPAMPTADFGTGPMAVHFRRY